MDIIRHLLSSSYLFNRYPGPFTSVLAYYLIGFIVFAMVFALFVKAKAKKGDILAKKTAQKLFSLAWTMGWIGIIFWTFRQINVFYLSAPIFWLIWLLVSIGWAALVFKYVIFVAPKRRKDIEQFKKKKDYLPQ